HGQHGGAPVDRRADRLALGREIRSDQRLFTILAASDVEQVVRTGGEPVADADPLELERQTTPARTGREHGDVAPVGVDVQVLGVEMPDPDLHAARSQYGRTKPRRETILRSPSIAV